MKANELRIGNIVYEGLDIFEITSITKGGQLRLFSAKENHSSGVSKIKPIPLTEEWLLRMGIYIEGQSISLKSGTIGVIQRNRDGRFKYYLQGAFGMVHLDSIQHVHQLQNLYFVLIGEELVIK